MIEQKHAKVDSLVAMFENADNPAKRLLHAKDKTRNILIIITKDERDLIVEALQTLVSYSAINE